MSAIAVASLAALGFAVLAARRGAHRRIGGCIGYGILALVLAVVAGVAGIAGLDVLSYHRLTGEAPALEATFARRDDGRWTAMLTYPRGAQERFTLAGDAWQVDARVIKWRGPATLLGFDTVYRLERLSGRYDDVERERTAPRTVHALHPPRGVDLWSWLRTHGDWVPWIDASYGSGVYLPLADGASYVVTVSPTGLVARPLNLAARQAVSGWR